MHRPLKVYAFDPARGRHKHNQLTVKVRHEALAPGPVGEMVAIVDYDATHDCYYRAVDLDDRAVLLNGGLEPSETDPRFHQQMVYAVVMETIRRFEFALGRRVSWRRDLRRRAEPYHGKLRILPHGLQEANAWYDPDLRALVFGYFAAPEGDWRGQLLFTCLSHDIVVHEATHALVDGLREHFSEPTSADTAGFHEAFADLVALFQHFSLKDSLVETVRRGGGLIHRPRLPPRVEPAADGPRIAAEIGENNPLVELARQFGEGLGMRAALRSALGTVPDPRALASAVEPHERGALLVAAVFDAFFTVYLRRTADLLRMGKAARWVSEGDVHPDLAVRLAGTAAKTAQHFVNICIRAVDYCPPVDLRLGEFLRAMITADVEVVPEDPLGYRAALIDAFRARGIAPEGVRSWSEEALRWPPAPASLGCCPGLPVAAPQVSSPERQRRYARALVRFGRDHAGALGLSPRYPVKAHSFRSIQRVGPDGRVVFELACELLQQRREQAGETPFQFRGGTTVIFDGDGRVRYAIPKPIDSPKRLAEQREYWQQFLRGRRLALPSFRSMHRGWSTRTVGS